MNTPNEASGPAERRQEAGRFVILADESANWKVAGLTQLQRLAFALNEFAVSAGAQIKVEMVVFWKPQVPVQDRWLPSSLPHALVQPFGPQIRQTEPAYVVGTSLLVGRNGIVEFRNASAPAPFPIVEQEASELWQQLSIWFETHSRTADGPADSWRVLQNKGDIAVAETQLLAATGKSQDGLVSTVLNRPISRRVTRVLLNFPIRPTTWTWIVLVLPVIAWVFLLRGTYADVVMGALLYQVHSILDGCDGEIARCKYLDSKKGARIDDLCDLGAGMAFPVALGFGLANSQGWDQSSFYHAVEGILCAVVIGGNELLLRVGKSAARSTKNPSPTVLYPRHRQLIQHSGILFFGEPFALLLVKATKRDVAVLFFLILAVAGVAQWILHITLAVTTVIFSLSLITRWKKSPRHETPVL